MPFKSAKQRRLFEACAHGAGYSKCPPKKAVREYISAEAKKRKNASRKVR